MASIFIICSVLVVFTCSSLDDPANGQVVTTGFEVGDTATYICNEGYSLQGREMRECQSNGVWSGRAPFCVGEYFEKSTFTYSSLNDINLLLFSPKGSHVLSWWLRIMAKFSSVV